MKIAYCEELRRPGEWFSRSKSAPVFDNCYKRAWDVLLPVTPASREDLCLVHDPKYVDDVLSLRTDDGFGERSAGNVEHILYSVGAHWAATEAARRCETAVFAPVSGFHHAHHNYGSGFCTFNGLVISAIKSGASKVLIIDGDGHYGDGTDGCLSVLGIKHIYNLSSQGGCSRDGDRTLRFIKDTLDVENWDLVLYQAGADAHYRDHFGVGYLTDAQWRERDRIVFSACREQNIPLVWNLAGGYSGVRTINLHFDTFCGACAIYQPRRPDRSLSRPTGNVQADLEAGARPRSALPPDLATK